MEGLREGPVHPVRQLGGHGVHVLEQRSCQYGPPPLPQQGQLHSADMRHTSPRLLGSSACSADTQHAPASCCGDSLPTAPLPRSSTVAVRWAQALVPVLEFQSHSCCSRQFQAAKALNGKAQMWSCKTPSSESLLHSPPMLLFQYRVSPSIITTPAITVRCGSLATASRGNVLVG